MRNTMQKYYILMSIQSIFDALLHHFALSILTPCATQRWPNDKQNPTTTAGSQSYCPKSFLLDAVKSLLLAVCKRHIVKRYATNNYSKSELLPKSRF